MSKAVTKGLHWLPRKSQYSLHGQRNGRVDVLPTNAIEQLYDIGDQVADGRQRIGQLRATREALSADLHALTRKDALRLRFVTDRRHSVPDKRIAAMQAQLTEIDNEARRVRRNVGELVAMISSKKHVSFETAFLRVAQAELAREVWERLADKATRLVAQCREK